MNEVDLNFPLRHPYKEVATEDMDAAKILLEVRDLETMKDVKILVNIHSCQVCILLFSRLKWRL